MSSLGLEPPISRKFVLEFTKMSGAGNDFIVIDNRFYRFSGEELFTMAARFCPRRTGVGADGLLSLQAADREDVDFRMAYYNADGSLGTMCGNGARCIARFIAGDNADTDRVWKLAYPAGVALARIQADGDVVVDMGAPNFEPASLPFVAESQQDLYTVSVAGESVELAAVSMGNPHGVIEVEDVSTAPVERLGPLLESHERFPNRANIGFMQVVSPDRIRLRVFERGVGETSAP